MNMNGREWVGCLCRNLMFRSSLRPKEVFKTFWHLAKSFHYNRNLQLLCVYSKNTVKYIEKCTLLLSCAIYSFTNLPYTHTHTHNKCINSGSIIVKVGHVKRSVMNFKMHMNWDATYREMQHPFDSIPPSTTTFL